MFAWLCVLLLRGEGADLPARHAGRKTIAVEDVMLLSRRNEGLEAVLRGHLDEIRALEKGSAGNKRR